METTELRLAGGGLLRLVESKRWLSPTSLRAALTLLAWLPLLVLSVLEGYALGDKVDLPFLADPVPHARFLVAFPIFIAAGFVINQRVSHVVSYLWYCDILVGEDRARFQTAVRQAAQRTDSVAIDIISIIAAWAVAGFLVRGLTEDGISTWLALVSGDQERLTAAGWWYAIVSLPLWLVVCFRWMWRVAVWWLFLWRLSRLNLRLLPTHPDRAGGLGIIEMGQASMATLVVGLSAVLSANLASEMIHSRQTLVGVAPMIVIYLLLVLTIVLLPLLAFTGKLVRTKHVGLVDYGDLAEDLFQAFDAKWAKKDDEEQRKLLGNPDPSSLADYGYAYEVVTEMRVLPFGRKSAVAVVALALLPFVPLLFLEYSVKETAQWLFGIIG